MAISKRLRFEILRRDGHTCRYCGQKAPNVALTVDHVVPEALGGKTEPANLVAACSSCNAGKASVAPDSPLVADIDADLLRYRQALDLAIQERSEQRDEIIHAVVIFNEEWLDWHLSDGSTAGRPLDWEDSVEQWVTGGLAVDELTAKIPKAMARARLGQEWRYFCGIAWKMLTELQDRAREIAEEQDMTERLVLLDREDTEWAG